MAEAGAWIFGVGMVTPVGGCAAQTASSVRAGISRYQESPVYNKRFASMTLALVPEEALPPLAEPLAAEPGLTARQTRMLRLAQPALVEALESLPAEAAPPPLLLAGPEGLPGRPPAMTEAFPEHLSAQSDGSFDLDQSRLFATGRAAGFEAAAAALDLLAEGTTDYVLLGGIDSYLDLYLLGTLDLEDRVLAEGVMDGFAPGEGAAFLLLGSDDAREKAGETAAIHLSPPGLAEEPGHRGSDQPYRGDGLAEAVALALAAHEDGPVRTVLGSLNGENFGAKEWGVAALRNQTSLDPDFRFEHPAECFGDTGAAAGPLLIGLAALALRAGTLPGPCLAWGAAEGAQRAAACVSLSKD